MAKHRVYASFTEREYILLKRVATLDARCPGMWLAKCARDKLAAIESLDPLVGEYMHQWDMKQLEGAP